MRRPGCSTSSTAASISPDRRGAGHEPGAMGDRARADGGVLRRRRRDASGAPRTIFAVGDEKQSIFSFQGADPAQFDVNRQLFQRAGRNAPAHDLRRRAAADIAPLGAAGTAHSSMKCSRRAGARKGLTSHDADRSHHERLARGGQRPRRILADAEAADDAGTGSVGRAGRCGIAARVRSRSLRRSIARADQGNGSDGRRDCPATKEPIKRRRHHDPAAAARAVRHARSSAS